MILPKRFTHIDESGKASMVDVSSKEVTQREAEASAEVYMKRETLERLVAGEIAKGDVFACARIAGIQAAKQTGYLIPLAHPLGLAHVSVDFDPYLEEECIRIRATCKTCERTGVEMEALTACALAALTLYDMCKAVDRGITISNLRLERKSGGRSGLWTREAE